MELWRGGVAFSEPLIDPHNDPRNRSRQAKSERERLFPHACWLDCLRGGGMLLVLGRGLAGSAVQALLLIAVAAVRWTGAGATTLVAARFEGGVVIGADSRTSQGSFVANRLADKITPVAPSIFLARSGSSAGRLMEKWVDQ